MISGTPLDRIAVRPPAVLKARSDLPHVGAIHRPGIVVSRDQVGDDWVEVVWGGVEPLKDAAPVVRGRQAAVVGDTVRPVALLKLFGRQVDEPRHARDGVGGLRVHEDLAEIEDERFDGHPEILRAPLSQRRGPTSQS